VPLVLALVATGDVPGGWDLGRISLTHLTALGPSWWDDAIIVVEMMTKLEEGADRLSAAIYA
jgi:multidrug efflux pump subunit AcrB